MMTLIKSPLAGWMGGKMQLSRHIVPLIPDHECYVEPFAGAAWIFFRKPESAVEVLNDLNRDIVTLYRVIQYHLEEFIRTFRWALISRDEFNRWLRLARVYVENLPYSEVIARYDRPTTFFYLDPPYWGCEDYYGKALFSREDFSKLAEQLAGLQGRFILSLNDTPEVRALFAGFEIQTVTCRYSCGASARPLASELLITNFTPQR